MLEALRVRVSQADQIEADLVPNLIRVQRFFQQQVMNLGSDGLLPQAESCLRSYQTEINKQLRLLGTDFTFLKAARQAHTQQQRRVQIGDRLQVLIDYCDALLQPDDNQSS